MSDYLRMDEMDLCSDGAERALMAALGFRADAIAGLLTELSGSDFANPHRGSIWNAARVLSEAHQHIEPTSIARQMVTDGTWQSESPAQRILATETTETPQMHLLPAAATEVADLARRRELLRSVKRAHTIVFGKEGDVSEAVSAIQAEFDQFTTQTGGQGGTRTWAQMIADFEAAHDPANKKAGIHTPWAKLDALIGGLFGGRLYVIGGSAGDGKSTAAYNIAYTAAKAGHATLIFSKEMPTVDVFARLIAAPSATELAVINRRELTETDRTRVGRSARFLDLPISANSDPVNMSAIKSIAREARHRGELDLMVVDYLQLIDSGLPTRTQEEEIAKVSTALKTLAMELDIPLVVPAQLNRSPHARPGARPTKADLRGSGRIEQDADCVILLFHPVTDLGTRTGQVVMILDKNRHGPKGEVVYEFNGGYGQIGDIA